MQKVYIVYKEDIERRTDKNVSLLKLANYIINNLLEIFKLSATLIKQQIETNCSYDKRSDRWNMTDLINEFKY